MWKIVASFQFRFRSWPLLSSLDSDCRLLQQVLHPCRTPDLTKRGRCFPKFDADLQEFITEQMDGSSVAATFSAVKEEFGGTGERVQRYVADITKGWVIIVVGGLCTSVAAAMVKNALVFLSKGVVDLADYSALLCRRHGMGHSFAGQCRLHRMHLLCLCQIWKTGRDGIRRRCRLGYS